MKNIIIVIIIITLAGLIGFSVVRQQNVSKQKSELKTNVSKQTVQANLRQATLKISGMTCVSCATGIEYALKEKAGVVDANINYDNENGEVIYNPQKISKNEIIQSANPYTATIIEDKPFK